MSWLSAAMILQGTFNLILLACIFLTNRRVDALVEEVSKIYCHLSIILKLQSQQLDREIKTLEKVGSSV